MAATVSTVPWFVPCLIDQLDLCVADFIVGARPVFGGGGRGSVGTANG